MCLSLYINATQQIAKLHSASASTSASPSARSRLSIPPPVYPSDIRPSVGPTIRPSILLSRIIFEGQRLRFLDATMHICKRLCPPICIFPSVCLSICLSVPCNFQTTKNATSHVLKGMKFNEDQKRVKNNPWETESLYFMKMIITITSSFENTTGPSDGQTGGRTDGRTDRQMDGWMDGQTRPLIEMRLFHRHLLWHC